MAPVGRGWKWDRPVAIWSTGSRVWAYPAVSKGHALWLGCSFQKRIFWPWSMGNFARLFICFCAFTCHISSRHLHSETCFTMDSNNWISLPNYMKICSPKIRLSIGTVSLFFNSLLGLGITFPCLLALLSCFSPQLVSNLLSLFSLHCLSLILSCSQQWREKGQVS